MSNEMNASQLVEPLILLREREALRREGLVDEDDGAAALEHAHRHRDLEGARQVRRPVVEEALERADADHHLQMHGENHFDIHF